MLKTLEFQTITNFKCLAKLIEITSNPPVNSNVLCALPNEADDGICDGDSGGALVYDDHLVGVISWGYGCDKHYATHKGYPDGFQRISQFTEWIDGILASRC